ncbi:MAG TPA: methyltransferase domain-containing protein, partial [Pyrinomonadaceae bacterium]|nr:methyltransferase domain-containing protein [Pyrinomonadaceae bacterium]
MADSTTAFVGSVPENYDRFMGPMFFEPYAVDLAERLPIEGAETVLEIACGTGIVTRAVRDIMPSACRIVATDLNQGMIDIAQSKFQDDSSVEFRQADAGDLPFGDASFDAVVCQFGLMFFPDKPAAMREVLRVLKPRGTFLFNVWDPMEENEISLAVHDAMQVLYPDDPPQFYRVPFGFNDAAVIRSLLEDAGFTRVEVETVPKDAVSPDARSAAAGL